MADFNSQYNKAGITLIRHFLEPRIINSSTYFFPDDSKFFWFKPSDGIEKLDRGLPYLNKVKKANVVTLTKFTQQAEGVSRRNEDLVTEAYNRLVKGDKKLKFLKPDVMDTGKDLTILNYGILNFVHDYVPDLNNRVWKYTNVFKRMLEDLKTTTSNRFILFEMPNKLPSMSELDTFANRLVAANITKLSDYTYFNLIELWKFLTPTLKDKSLLNGISNPKLKNTTLVLSMETKIVLINLSWLFNTIAEYRDAKYVVNTEQIYLDFYNLLKGESINLEDLNTTKQYPADVIRRCIYILIYQLVHGKSVDINKLKEETKDLDEKAVNTLLTKMKKNNKIDLQTVLDEYIIEENSDVIELDKDTEIAEDGFDFAKLEEDEAKVATATAGVFESIEELKKYKAKDDARMKAIRELEYLRENKLISTANYKKFLQALDNQDKIINPYSGEGEISNILDYDTDDFVIKDTDTQIANSVILFDKAASEDTNGASIKKYIMEQYHKDIVRAVYGLQQNNIIILNYKINHLENIMGASEEHEIEVMNLNGKKTTLRFEIPYIDEDGVFSVSSNKYRIRMLRTEVPIRKIDGLTVCLNSYYGKLFVSKARFSSYNIGDWFSKSMIAKQDKNKMWYDKKLTNLNIVGSETPDANLPLVYGQISRNTKGFVYDDIEFVFDYRERQLLLDGITDEELAKLESNNGILIGRKGKVLYFMLPDNDIVVNDGKKSENIGSIYTLLNIDTDTMPIEYAGIILLKEYTPIVVLLSYYLGLENLLKLTKVKYSYDGPKARVNITKDQYVVKLADKKIIFTKDYGLNDLIYGGLLTLQKQIKDLPMDVFNNRVKFNTMFNLLFKMESTVRYTNEIKLIENMFIDPMTLNVLKEMKEPENVPALLIRACELLTDDNYRHPNNLNDMLIKGYERIAGFIYKELVTVVKDYENKSMFSRANMVMDKYAIMNKINEDSTKVPIDDLNPIAAIKQKEDLSYLGDGGRSKDTMVKATRELHTSEIGIVSEAAKDNGNVGITAYITADAKINNTLGIIKDTDKQELGWHNRLSTPGMLAPFGLTDGSKRLNFASIHAAHVIPISNMIAPYVLTGYETMVPIKAGNRFAVIAKMDGKVTARTTGSITVEYKDKKKETYKLYSWTSKEESGSCYTHELVANLEVGTEFIKDDTIAYDKLFFEPCLFEPRRVIYKQGTLVNVMVSEDSQTFEDSAAISERLNSLLGTTLTKVKSITMEKDTNILDLVNIGDNVEPNDTLFTMLNAEIPLDKKLDERAMEILKEMSSSSPKAKVKGVISKIVCYYNFDPLTASNSIQELIKYSDGVLKELTGFTGRVNSGYSIQGVPLQEDSLELKIYIQVNEKMGTGDKYILGNQMKGTVGEVFDYKMTTENGDDIDMVFSKVSMSARIVNSPDLLGTTITLIKKLEEEAIKTYFK